MIQPGRYDITLQQGATFEMTVQYKDSDGVPVDMTGYSIVSKVYNRLGTEQVAEFSTPWQLQESGIFKMKLSSAVTSGITQQGQYDVLVTDPFGDRFYILEGTVFVSIGLSNRA